MTRPLSASVRRLCAGARRLGPALALPVFLAACGGGQAEGPVRAVGPDLAPPADPIAAFAAQAAPGTQSRILLADGQPANVRLLRSYHAASGRECREVLVGAGMSQRSQLVCLGDAGWSSARPLLPGAVAGRP